MEKKAWKTDSYDGALLFLLLHKRVAEDPDDFSASEIQQNPLFEFDKYSAQTFKRNCQTVANKVKKFEKNGTGLTKKFKEFCRQVLEDWKKFFAKADKDPPFDKDYTEEKEEEDLTYISKAENENTLSYPLQDQKFHPTPDSEQPPIDTSNIEPPNSDQWKSNRKTNSTEAPPINEVNMMATTKPGVYLEDYADGQIVGVYPLPSGWDGTFKIGDDQQSVIMTTKIPRSIYNA